MTSPHGCEVGDQIIYTGSAQDLEGIFIRGKTYIVVIAVDSSASLRMKGEDGHVYTLYVEEFEVCGRPLLESIT